MMNSETNNSRFSSVYDCTIIELDKHHHEKGNITVVENNITIPFGTKRVYYLYDIPGGESRGAHAHKELSQLVIAASGSFDVILDDGKERKIFSLNRSYYGLYVPKGLWRQMENFSTNALALIVASTTYNAEDYIYDYEEFLKHK
ncbi:sugar 3,4-ketoisomerase [Microbacter margulisiae]|uniref:Putative RmlC-like cupin family protein n=1 Tax=Microbacter margulisiae TaxID=1350067 RepID=A0A7W5H0W1_9PORP|nr:FdtA/QdtA family cupin domain-containing protein [Microbacter margulisiae]MBB3186004.1 putative RmlC-like cupin family protein [Microbacter margulisiae]